MKRLAWLAVGLIAAAKVFDLLPFSYYQPYNYWLTSPNLVANRTAITLLFPAGCDAWKRRSSAPCSIRSIPCGWFWLWRRRDSSDPLPVANPALANVPCAN